MIFVEVEEKKYLKCLLYNIRIIVFIWNFIIMLCTNDDMVYYARIKMYSSFLCMTAWLYYLLFFDDTLLWTFYIVFIWTSIHKLNVKFCDFICTFAHCDVDLSWVRQKIIFIFMLENHLSIIDSQRYCDKSMSSIWVLFRICFLSYFFGLFGWLFIWTL